jgi:hypothetical protein
LIINDSEVYREGRGGGRGGKTPLSLRRERERYGGDAVKVAPLARIEDDYRAVKKDRNTKISELTLRYLLSRRIIKRHLFAGYMATHTRSEERKTLTEKNVINDVNNKLVELYESA